MKKLIVIVVFFTGLLLQAQENELNVGVNGGITIGNIEAQSPVAFGVDANYLFSLNEDFLVGPSLSMVYFSPKDVALAKMYLPIGVAGRLQSVDTPFFVGMDLGFAIGLSPNGDRGGIYFKPMVGYDITDKFKINLFYSAVKKKQPTYGYIGLGISFNVFGSGGDYYSY